MSSQEQEERVWAALEIAVRTHGEPLPLDAFLQDPEEAVAHLMKVRAERNAPEPSQAQEVHEALVQEELFEEIIEETEIIEPLESLEEETDVEDELRRQLSGDSFAELDDVG